MGWFGKKKTKEEPDGGFKFELFGDDRDENLNQYQLDGMQILAKMEAELEFMRRQGQMIERRFYGFQAESNEGDVAIVFEHPMEGIELMRRYAGKPTKWFRLRDENEKEGYEPFEGEPAKYRTN